LFFYNRLRRPGFGGLIVGGLATAHNMVQMLRSQKDSLGLAIKGRLGTLSQKDGSTSLAPGTLSETAKNLRSARPVPVKKNLTLIPYISTITLI